MATVAVTTHTTIQQQQTHPQTNKLRQTAKIVATALGAISLGASIYFGCRYIQQQHGQYMHQMHAQQQLNGKNIFEKLTGIIGDRAKTIIHFMEANTSKEGILSYLSSFINLSPKQQEQVLDLAKAFISNQNQTYDTSTTTQSKVIFGIGMLTGMTIKAVTTPFELLRNIIK